MNIVGLFYLVFLTLALLVIAKKTFSIIKSDERAVIFRLGKFHRVQSPGLLVIVPFFDKVVKVKAKQISGSDRMNEDQLLTRIAEIHGRD